MRVIGGKFKRASLFGPDPANKALRATHDRIRENVFNLLAPVIEGAAFLDLFGGTGGIGIEALSRGAASAVFVDDHPASIAVIKRNIEKLGLRDSARVVRSDALRFLRAGAGREAFDIVYVDPPYAAGLLEPVLEELGKGDALNPGAVVVCEQGNRPEAEKAGLLNRIDARRYGKHIWLTIWKLENEE